MHHSDMYFLRDEQNPSIDCFSIGNDDHTLRIGDVRVFPTLDQLEQIRGAIDIYLHERRPAPTAKHTEPCRCSPVAAEDVVDAHYRGATVDPDDLMEAMADAFTLDETEGRLIGHPLAAARKGE